MGHDFGRVRVHTDARAAEAARAIQASAYTIGQDIYFGGGRFQPALPSGLGLLAHELSHTIQQRASGAPAAGIKLGEPDSPFEREAERAEQAVGQGSFYSPTLAAARTAARQGPVPTYGVTPTPPTQASANLSDSEVAEAGLMALAKLLKTTGAAVEPFRTMYNQGEAAIAAKRLEMQAAGASEAAVAKQVAAMRNQLALEVREASGSVQKKAAELFDLIRGNVERPGYTSLRAAGKTDAQIILTATKTNKFVNALPTGLKWTGKGIWLVTAGVSIYLIIEAPPEKKAQVAAQEGGGLAGGVLGGATGEAACVVLGIVTEGIGLLACGLLGGLVGMELGRRAPAGLIAGLAQVEEQRMKILKSCDELPWYKAIFCYMGASGMGSPPF